MKPEDALRLLELGLYGGQAVLFVSLDDLDPVFLDRMWTINPSNLMEVAGWIYGGKGGLYHDPDGLLDAAMIDKMIVVGGSVLFIPKVRSNS